MLYTHRIRVRYCDVDKMNIVYHGRFMDYWEWARTELFRSVGFPYSEIEQIGYILPSKQITINYHSPLRYDEEIRIECRLIELTKIKLVFDYNVYSETGLLAADGNTIHVFTDQNLKLMKLTSDLYQRLKRITHEIHPDQ